MNLSLTLRNWLIGSYIAEYLSSRLSESGMEGMAPRTLRQYRRFYFTYPGIWQTLSAKSLPLPIPSPIRQTLSAKSQPESQTASQSSVSGMDLFQRLSFSHFAELIKVPDKNKRTF